jgi:hypothetical protein
MNKYNELTTISKISGAVYFKVNYNPESRLKKLKEVLNLSYSIRGSSWKRT